MYDSLLLFDIDRAEAVMAWHDANLPMPYWTAQTLKNGHAHICYKLEIPLCTSELASQKAISYAAKIQAGLANKLGADVGYSHLITKTLFILIGVQPFGLKEPIRSII